MCLYKSLKSEVYLYCLRLVSLENTKVNLHL